MSIVDAASFQAAAHAQLRRASTELSTSYLKGAIEALVFASPEPITARELARAVKTHRAELGAVLEELAADYEGRGIMLAETHRGFVFLTNPTFAAVVRGVTAKKPMRLSRAQLETLAIVAYRQPITRPEIDEIRGVDSGPVLRVLLERELCRVLGKKEEPGRPLLYGTTEEFLSLFQLKALADLPTLREFTELSAESKDTYERRLGDAAPSGAIVFDDEPDERIDPTVPREDEAVTTVVGDSDAPPAPASVPLSSPLSSPVDGEAEDPLPAEEGPRSDAGDEAYAGEDEEDDFDGGDDFDADGDYADGQVGADEGERD
jgi:segregation and condensation protein B